MTRADHALADRLRIEPRRCSSACLLRPATGQPCACEALLSPAQRQRRAAILADSCPVMLPAVALEHGGALAVSADPCVMRPSLEVGQ